MTVMNSAKRSKPFLSEVQESIIIIIINIGLLLLLFLSFFYIVRNGAKLPVHE